MSDASVAHFKVADITLSVHADLPIIEETFSNKIVPFRITKPGDDIVSIHHHFAFPLHPLTVDTGQVAYQRENNWTIFNACEKWVYDRQEFSPSSIRHHYHAEWSADHSRGEIFHVDAARWLLGGNDALTLMTTDQILLARVLAERQGCLVHAAGMDLWGKGFLFVGHSGAGKSTTVTMLRDHGTILCDDRIAVRRMTDTYRIYGTWHHGTVPLISPQSAPLHAVCFIEQAETNRAIRLTDPREVLSRFLPRLVRPLVTHDWWEKTLATTEDLVRTVPIYRLQLDLSGRVVDILREL